MIILSLATVTSFSVPQFTSQRRRYHAPSSFSTARYSSSSSSTSSAPNQNQQQEPSSDNNDDETKRHLPLQHNKHSIRFLGRGADAIVRPGCVLVAPLHEASHFLMRAALLVVDVGIIRQDDDDEEENAEYIIRAVILDHPTPFTMKEMVPHMFENHHDDNSTTTTTNATHILAEQFLFRGGDVGGDAVLLLHSNQDIGTSNYEIGSCGIYQGGVQEALQRCQSPQDALQYKFFFNYCQFTESELEQMLAATNGDDAWMSVEVSPSFILNPEFDRGDAWAFLRNTVKQRGY
jgi:putative AlgH/UPF0301 family transcriptional regulator